MRPGGQHQLKSWLCHLCHLGQAISHHRQPGVRSTSQSLPGLKDVMCTKHNVWHRLDVVGVEALPLSLWPCSGLRRSRWQRGWGSLWRAPSLFKPRVGVSSSLDLPQTVSWERPRAWAGQRRAPALAQAAVNSTNTKICSVLMTPRTIYCDYNS